MFLAEGFGVGESILIVKPKPHCRFRNLNSAGQLANRNPAALSRDINELLKRGVRMKRRNQPAAWRRGPAIFPLGQQPRHFGTIAPASTKASAVYLSAYL